MAEESQSNAKGLPFPINIEDVLGINNVPPFLEELMVQRFCRNYNTFILYGNTLDGFPLEIKSEETGKTEVALVTLKLILRYFFGSKALKKQEKAGAIFYYPQNATWRESDIYKNTIKSSVEETLTRDREEYNSPPFNDPPVGHTEAIDKLTSVLSTNLATVIGVIDSAETLLSQEDWRNSAANMIASMITQFGAQDSTTYDMNFSTLILISNQGYKGLHPALKNEEVIKPIYVDLPSADQRKRIFDCSVEGFSLAGTNENTNTNGYEYIKTHMGDLPEDKKMELVKNSGGCSNKDLIKFMQEKAARGNLQNLPDALLEFRRNLIKSQGEGIIELVTPEHGREAVGGLDYVFEILEKSVYPHLKSSSPLAPTGLLMMGPPGTGKSITAEAMAKECGLTFVNFRIENVFRWFVGSSESRMDHVLDLIQNVSPCIVFIDEIDQMGMDRGGFQGDSGVSSRIFKRLLEFMGDDSNNGKVFFVAATNEVTHLDSAIKRSGRFDIKIPMIPRGVDSRIGIFNALINKHRATIEKAGITVDEVDLREVAQKCKDLVGSDLEFVLKKALRSAFTQGKSLTTEILLNSAINTVPSVDKEKRVRYIQEALTECNDLESLPEDILKLKQGKQTPHEKSLGVSELL